MATLKNYKVTAKTATGRTITDTFYVANEREARIDFRACYRHDDYTIVQVVPAEPDTMTEDELYAAMIAEAEAIENENHPRTRFDMIRVLVGWFGQIDRHHLDLVEKLYADNWLDA